MQLLLLLSEMNINSSEHNKSKLMPSFVELFSQEFLTDGRFILHLYNYINNYIEFSSEFKIN